MSDLLPGCSGRFFALSAFRFLAERPVLSFSSLRPLRFLFSSSALNPFLLFLHLDSLRFLPSLKLPQFLRLLLFDQPVSPPRYSFHRQRPQSDALQLFQRMFFLEQHAPKLFLLCIPHARFVPIIRRPPARRVWLPHRSHLHASLFSQALQVRQRQHSFHLHLIDLFQLCPLVQHFRRQVAVIRQKHQPRRRILQIPHREHALRQSAQTISQRLPPFRVRHRRHHFRRLVQHNVNAPPCVRLDNLSRRLDAVLRRIRLRPQLPHHAPIHAHLSAGNQQLRMPPRSNPRPRNYFL